MRRCFANTVRQHVEAIDERRKPVVVQRGGQRANEIGIVGQNLCNVTPDTDDVAGTAGRLLGYRSLSLSSRPTQ